MTRPTHFSYPVIPDRLSMDRHRSAARGVYLHGWDGIGVRNWPRVEAALATPSWGVAA
jgi:hypothetical protein